MNFCMIPNPLRFLHAAAWREHRRKAESGKTFIVPCYKLSSVIVSGEDRTIILRDVSGRHLATYKTKRRENGRWQFWREG